MLLLTKFTADVLLLGLASAAAAAAAVQSSLIVCEFKINLWFTLCVTNI